MSFLEGIGKKLAQSGQEAAQKAKNAAEIIKINSMISDEEKRINNLHIQTGKLYYEVYGENPEPQFAQFITDINNCKAQIEAHSEQIRVIKGIVACGSCGGQVPIGAPFCSSCGSPIKSAQSAPANAIICVGCGASLEPNAAFCLSCGQKAEQASAAAGSESPVADVQKECTSCGEKCASNVAFCLNCGTKFDS